jgi:hypothetical protein
VCVFQVDSKIQKWLVDVSSVWDISFLDCSDCVLSREWGVSSFCGFQHVSCKSVHGLELATDQLSCVLCQCTIVGGLESYIWLIIVYLDKTYLVRYACTRAGRYIAEYK